MNNCYNEKSEVCAKLFDKRDDVDAQAKKSKCFENRKQPYKPAVENRCENQQRDLKD